jgi:hypothetical protein
MYEIDGTLAEEFILEVAQGLGARRRSAKHMAARTQQRDDFPVIFDQGPASFGSEVIYALLPTLFTRLRQYRTGCLSKSAHRYETLQR